MRLNKVYTLRLRPFLINLKSQNPLIGRMAKGAGLSSDLLGYNNHHNVYYNDDANTGIAICKYSNLQEEGK